MCIFSQPVQDVCGTQIFARVIGGAPPRQILVYEMAFSAAGDLAMLLPLPTPKDSAEDAVEFVSLESYPKFFEEMEAGFPRLVAHAGSTNSDDPPMRSATLKVHSVGSFEASFVPKQTDFSRLDERFRLPAAALAALTHVADYGFAVFKLKAGTNQKVHPMALTFPTRNPQQIFFPTAHLHDGTFPGRAVYDHALYFQGSDTMRLPLALDTGTGRLGRLAGKVIGVAGGAKAPETSVAKASEFMKEMPEDLGLVDPEMKVHRYELRERLPNRDAVLWPKYHDKAGQYA